MQWLVIVFLTSMGCSGNRRPVSKRLVTIANERTVEPIDVKAETAVPWQNRQSRWSGGVITTAPGIRWSIPTKGPVVHPIRFDGERIFAVAGGEVLALTPEGQILWRANVSANGPVGFGDAGVFVSTRSGTVQVLDPLTGDLRESHVGDHAIDTAPLPLGPAVAWVDETGTLSTTAGRFDRILEGPVSDAATHEDILVVGNEAGNVIATTTIRSRWQSRVPGPVLSHPVLDGARAYIAYGAREGQHGGIRAFDLETGDVVWETRLPSAPSGPPAVGQHIIVADSRARVFALDREHGGIRWRAPTASTVTGQPAVQADAIYISRHDGFIDRMDMTDGGTVWSVDVGGAATGQMCHTPAGIVLGTANGRIMGLGRQ